MKLKQPAVPVSGGTGRKTPGFVWGALCVNLLLLLAAFILPRRIATVQVDGATSATLLFALSMALILIIGFATAIRSYILARRRESRMPLAALLPLSLFAVGVGIALGLSLGSTA